MELFSIDKVSLIWVPSSSNTGTIRDDPYWTSRKNSLDMAVLSRRNKVTWHQVQSIFTIFIEQKCLAMKIHPMNIYFIPITNKMPGNCFIQTHVKVHEIGKQITIDTMHKIVLFFRICRNLNVLCKKFYVKITILYEIW